MSRALGAAAEARAAEFLARKAYRIVDRNWTCKGGEIDLVCLDGDGTLVFVEVRSRSDERFGGAASSVGSAKRRRLVFAATHYLRRLPSPPPCRFDVVAVDGDRIEWLRAAFDAGD